MNVGIRLASDRYRYETNMGHETISKKNFDYKEKTNKIMLRDKMKKQEAEKLIEQQEREARVRANRMLAERRMREEKAKQNSLTSQDKSKKQPDKENRGIDSVTLTQNQLEKILSSITKVQGSSNGDLRVKLDDPNHLQLILQPPGSRESENAEPYYVKGRHDSSSEKLESLLNLAKNVKTSNGLNNVEGLTRRQNKDKGMNTNPQLVLNFELNSGKDSEKIGKKQYKKYDDDNVFVKTAPKVVIVEESSQKMSFPAEKLAEKQEPAAGIIGTTNHSPIQKPVIPKAHMTKAELKRLQWDLEAAENERLKKESEERTKRIMLNSEIKTQTFNDNHPARVVQKADSFQKVSVEPSFVPGLGSINNHQPLTHNAGQFSTVPMENLSKAELKRLQWEKERAAALPEYNPWGRPGPGVRPSDFDSKQNETHRPSNFADSNPKDSHIVRLDKIQHPTKEPEINFSKTIPYQDRRAASPVSNQNSDRNISTEPVKASLTKAQLLKLKWEAEKAHVPEDYNPFGKPGAGAPIRTDSGTLLTSYHSRAKYVSKVAEEKGGMLTNRSINEHQPRGTLDNPSQIASTKPSYDQQSSEEGSKNYLRGQLVNLDPITLKEREEQRRREIQHMEEIKKQVEEKQRLKREEELRAKREDAKIEERFKNERINEVTEHQLIQEKNKKNEEKGMTRVDLVADAIQKAKQEAELLKAKKRLEKLKAAGHDISNLLAAYEERFSPRFGPGVKEILTPRGKPPKLTNTESIQQMHTGRIEPTSVPGLDLSTLDSEGHDKLDRSRKNEIKRIEKENRSPVKESSVQTDTPVQSRNAPRKKGDKEQTNYKKNVRIISGPKSRVTKQPKDAKPWGYKNQSGKTFQKQSLKDPGKEEELKERHQTRREQLLKQVEANKQHIPEHKFNSANSPPDGDDGSLHINVKNKSKHQSITVTGKSTKAVTIDQSAGNAKSPSSIDDYLPYTRSDAVLSPSNGQDPYPVSREATQAALARQAYYKSMQPAQYGFQMHNLKDEVPRVSRNDQTKDPLFNPSALTNHPTERQQQLLESLRQMRQGLLARKKEMETAFTPDPIM